MASIIYSECLLLIRKPYELLLPITFLILLMVLFNFAIGVNAQFMINIYIGIAWMAVLFSLMISSSHLFKEDYLCGYLEQYLLQGNSLAFWVGTKIMTRWFFYCLPLIAVTSLLGLIFGLPWDRMLLLMESLFIGTLILNLLSALGAALTLTVHHNGLLLALIILPLFVPVLIFASALPLNDYNHSVVAFSSAILIALLVLSWTFLPVAIGFLLKMNLAFE